MNTFTNPILSGFHPDPSICRVAGDYYLVTSSFHFYPGLPVFHSNNLVDWVLIGYALDRPSQLPLQNADYSHGIFAPTIRYHNGIFYIVCTNVGNGGNFVITATNPAGPWSEPVWLSDAPGIDPSLFFDDDGKCYYTGNGDPEVSLYNGHHTIWLQELDLETLQLAGEKYVLVDGGSDISKKPIWIEGPHLFKAHGYYYLLAAEGGTGENHSEVVFRSRLLHGPYESYFGNPILSNRDREINDHMCPITCTGHADLVQTQHGEWWMVFLGCRPYPPYKELNYNTGRETFLIPMRWHNGWPVIRDGSIYAGFTYPKPYLKDNTYILPNSYNINTFVDHFDRVALNRRWNQVRTPSELWYSLINRPGFLRLMLRNEPINGAGNPSFLGIRQMHTSFTASTLLEANFKNMLDSAGIAVIQNGATYFAIDLVKDSKYRYVRLLKQSQREGADPIECCRALVESSKIYMRITADGGKYSFYYALQPENWIPLSENEDGRILSTRYTGGFVGSYVGLYAVSHDTTSQSWADFDCFEYAGYNDIYMQPMSKDEELYVNANIASPTSTL